MGGFFKNIGRAAGKILDPIGITGMLRGGSNPAAAARPYMEQIPGYGQQAHNPFIQQGQEAWNALRPQYEQFMAHPRETYNEDVAGYEPSARYQYMMPRMLSAMNSEAAAGGRSGSNDEQERRAALVQEMLGSDLGSYLGEINQRRGLGMQGFETATGRGHQSAGSLADFLGNAAGNRANLEYSGAAQQGQNKNALMNSLMKALATGAGAYFGGPAGAATGDAMSGSQQGQIGNQNLQNIQPRLPFSSQSSFGNRGYTGNYGGRR